jgi:Domain of unknown function (DUF1918)
MEPDAGSSLVAKGREAIMQATVGDRLHVHSKTVGDPDRIAEIVEVRGIEGAPPYLVRFPDGHETLVYPGSDSVIEPTKGRSR